ncbi:MAG: methylenetetrahydrofolate--tRNA-(uracil(54)-C(5))-methyltransferase (FADH(2)-oxidizing) TrmFO [Clostridiaceae bacterium]|nr:methylenetetrahydrofolate--tRNA-(uracil(54)-C(5))-methyltransferase (FADH(2)-oxidizing) TrmFO [Clostridiaceae bacterium]
MDRRINVVGAGLAGCEAAFQIAERGVPVRLYEMKPKKFSPAHKSVDFAELVCSNSFKARNIENASGLLKEEMKSLGSLIMDCALKAEVPAGGSLSVDRELFSRLVTERIESHPLIEISREEVTRIIEDEITIYATGPLTSDALSQEIAKLCPSFSFFDAAAPIVYAESIDMNHAFRGSRYGKGDDDYINCPLSKEEYLEFYNNLINAETAYVEDFDDLRLYEGCMPIEEMAKRGVDTLRFGPLKPVGFDKKYYAIVQLRQENLEGTIYNIVGFQTRLKFGEQKRVFGLIPALRNAEYARYGVMHRNTYLKSPKFLDRTYKVIGKNIFFAGQITGVEGYMDSTSSGLVAGINAARLFQGKTPIIFPESTAIGALANYVATYPGKDFQPMGINFGIIASGDIRIKNKAERRRKISENALEEIENIKISLNG